jgi:zinc protease
VIDRAPRPALAAVVALVLAACTSSAEPTTTSSESPPVSTTPASTSTTEDPLLRLALPVDPDVVQGSLDNGVTYYIRANDSPGGRAELRLLVDAGSVQEDPDQAGAAHFLEHMMFNGTERFPRNELVGALESFGPRFGPDINAHTTYDETVYELSLPTDDIELIDLGVAVLREWATGATLTEADVTEERGVVLDEWRLRAQGFGARVNERLDELILPGSVYEGHPPIGTADSINTMSPEVLRRFYEDWYTPERMTVVAVGDFDVVSMETRIAEAFGDVEVSPDTRPWEPAPYQPVSSPRVSSHADEEAAGGEVTVTWPIPDDGVETVGDYQERVAATLGIEIIAQRLSDDAATGASPFLQAAPVTADWARAIALRGVDVGVAPQDLEAGLESVLHEIERARRHGISAEEFERALGTYETITGQLFEQRDTAQDTWFAEQIAAHHLAGEDMMSPTQRYDVESDILGRLTEEDVETALLSVVGGAPLVLVLGPDAPGITVPTEEEVLTLLAGLEEIELEPRPTPSADDIDLMPRPAPAEIVRNTVNAELLYTTLQFANGADVYLWESDIASQGVYALIEGFGGTSTIEVADLPEVQLAFDMVSRSGVGDLDAAALGRLLSDRIVQVRPWISETRHGLEGSVSSVDVETLFQLIHLTMTRPRFDQAAVDAVLEEMRALDSSRENLPALLFEEAVSHAYYGDDPRYFVIPTGEQLADFDLATAERLFLDRFSSAGDFAFVFVGDFDIAVMTDLAARYVGTLPGNPEPRGFVDNQPLPPREVQVATVEAGTGEQGQLGMFFTNEHAPVLEDRLTARLVELILTARLRERVREGLSATYSITASIDLQRDPDPFAEAAIVSTGDPAGLDAISEAVLADLRELQEDGPTESQFDTAIEQLRNEMELIDNQTLAEALVTAHLYPDQPVAELNARHTVVEELTPEDVRVMAGLAFDLDQRIEVRQVPRP